MMDDAGVDACVLMGWSMGVNTMFEVAVNHPERVTGLFAVGGVPGDTFASMGAPIFIPRPLRKPITVNMARALKLAGRPLHRGRQRLPVGPLTYEVLSHTGFMMPMPDPLLARRAVKEFLTTPTDWYMHLALHSSLHLRVSLRNIAVPDQLRRREVRHPRLLPRHADRRRADRRRHLPGAARHALPPDGEARRGPRGAARPAGPRPRVGRARLGSPRCCGWPPDRRLPARAGRLRRSLRPGSLEKTEGAGRPRPRRPPTTSSPPSSAVRRSTGSAPSRLGTTPRSSAPSPAASRCPGASRSCPTGPRWSPSATAAGSCRSRVRRSARWARSSEARANGEGGLLGVAVSPSYATDHQVFFYASADDDNRVLRTTFGDGRLGALKPILTGIPQGGNHDGGRMVFGPGRDALRLHRRVRASPTSPRTGARSAARSCGSPRTATPRPATPTASSPVWTWGHRNVQGLAFDDDGNLWASEFGQDTFDELNLIEKGRNYGWPTVEGKGDEPGLHEPAGDLVDRRRLPLGAGVRRRPAVARRAAGRAAVARRRGRAAGQRGEGLLRRGVRPDAHRRGRPGRQPVGHHLQPRRPRRPGRRATTGSCSSVPDPAVAPSGLGDGGPAYGAAQGGQHRRPEHDERDRVGDRPAGVPAARSR